MLCSSGNDFQSYTINVRILKFEIAKIRKFYTQKNLFIGTNRFYEFIKNILILLNAGVFRQSGSDARLPIAGYETDS